MAVSSSHNTSEVFYYYQDREKVESICEVLRTVYSVDNKYGGEPRFLMDLNDLSWQLTRLRYKPLIFLPKRPKELLEFKINFNERFQRNVNLQDKLIICITGNSLDDLSSPSDTYHLIDAREGTSTKNVAFLIAKALNPTDPVLNLTELVRNIKLDPELSELVNSDKVLGPIFKILQASETNQEASETNQEIESGLNVHKHHGIESPLLKICTPKDIISEMPIWKGRMKMLLVLLDRVDLTEHLKTIENYIASKVEKRLPSTSAKKEKTECGDWDFLVKEEDKLGIYYLLKVKQFPTKKQLAEACEKFGRKSQSMKQICDIIGCNIDKSSKSIVWPAYRAENENHIVFVTDRPDFQQISDFEIKYWNVEKADSENSDVIKKAVQDDIMIQDDWLILLKRQINNHSSEVRKQHSNITIITASPIRSKGYKNGNHEMIVENCMVLLVPLKGLIPLQEDVIPRIIGGIKTDIREDSFQLHVGGKPSIEHKYLKMGCAIGSPGVGFTGTLGGFVEHPIHGVCALTCAHVLLAESERPLMDKTTTVNRYCLQPINSTNVFGMLKNIVFEDRGENKTGVDAALIKITDKFPVSGHFPDIRKKHLKETGNDL